MRTKGLATYLNFEPKFRRPDKSVWVHHLPFAYTFVKLVEPKLIVELGTCWGESYFSFCQAVKEINSATRCYSISTWSDDAHPDCLNDSIFQFVSKYNSENYSEFSQITRTALVDVVGQFADKSIDLLHIDGVQSYEAAKNGLDTYLPKVKEGGVILLHDICSRHDDCGAWKLWEELQASDQLTFSFPHGSGLGVLVNGRSDEVHSFLEELTHKEDQEHWRLLFRIADEHLQKHSETRKQIKKLEGDLIEREEFYTSLEASFAERDAAIDSLKASLAERDGTIASKDNVILSMRHSISWTITAPLREIYEALTRRFRSLTAVLQPATAIAPADHHPTIESASLPVTKSIGEILSTMWIELSPINFRTSDTLKTRITIITDSVSKGSLFGGVATAIIYASLWAIKHNAQIRLITRTEEADESALRSIIKLNEIDYSRPIECLFYPYDLNDELIIGHDEAILTTSWWTTQTAINSGMESQITYLLQEDERMFYPLNDQYLMAHETMANERIKFVVNSQYLYQHLISDGFSNLKTNGTFFEPSFNKRYYYCDGPQRKEQHQFFFYARPFHARNAYNHGLKIISKAIEHGIFSPDEWVFNFVGKHVPNMSLGDIELRIHDDITWEEYAKLIRTIDLGLCLMITPHTSYPPLDIAASGGVVVTNEWGSKTKISEKYSANIISGSLDETSMLAALTQGVALAKSYKTRHQNYCDNRITTCWNDALDSIL